MSDKKFENETEEYKKGYCEFMGEILGIWGCSRGEFTEQEIKKFAHCTGDYKRGVNDATKEVAKSLEESLKLHVG